MGIGEKELGATVMQIFSLSNAGTLSLFSCQSREKK
jgi:hypothetical protein